MKTRSAFLAIASLALAACSTTKQTAYDTNRMDRTHNPYAAQMITERQQQKQEEQILAQRNGENLAPIAAPPLVQGDRSWGQTILPSVY
jgi:hypothetical protein